MRAAEKIETQACDQFAFASFAGCFRFQSFCGPSYRTSELFFGFALVLTPAEMFSPAALSCSLKGSDGSVQKGNQGDKPPALGAT